MRDWLHSGQPKALGIIGGPGTGKSTALAHLSAVFADRDIDFLDEPTDETLKDLRHPVVFTAPSAHSPLSRVSLLCHLAPWDQDSVLEWLLATHRDQTGSVMARLGDAAQVDWPEGNARLWTLALSRMAVDPAILDATDAVIEHLDATLDPRLRRWAELCALCAFSGDPLRIDAARRCMRVRGCSAEVLRFLEHPPVWRHLAGEVLFRDLVQRRWRPRWSGDVPLSLLRVAASKLRADAPAREQVASWSPKTQFQPLRASVLHLSLDGWRPHPGDIGNLRGAYLESVRWAGIDLDNSTLIKTCFEQADLRKASLRRVRATEANFRWARMAESVLSVGLFPRADLAGADLRKVRGTDATFNSADLRGADLRDAQLERVLLCSADLRQADLRGADLRWANLVGARVEEADLRDTNLSGARLIRLTLREALLDGARFSLANLNRCDLEGVDLPAAEFDEAELCGALLTGSSIPGGNFRRANLRGAGLAAIRWKGADLGGARLTGATFHTGTTRSGLVQSTTAGEGSRTGFYTDESKELGFRSPEEIRVADLRDANLLDADVSGVDFYLVDLRGAVFSDGQRRHFERSGALL